MARPFYREVVNGFFHATSRGNARQIIYADDEDYERFLSELKHTVLRRRWRCLAYCLMPNHFHLVLQTPKGNLAHGMRDLKSDYARARNRRRGKDGHLFKAGFGRQLVQDDEYLLRAVTYVLQNPVRAGLVATPGEWPWSSFAATVSGASSFIDPTPFLELMHPEITVARQHFADAVHAESGLPPFDPTLPIVGDEAFIKRHAPAERPGREVVKRAWEQARPTLAELRTGRTETEFVAEARHRHRYTMREIAEHLGCHERTVRRRLAVSDAEMRPL